MVAMSVAARAQKYRSENKEKNSLVMAIGSDLSVKKKNLPNDPFFKAVTIRESRRRSTIVARDAGSDYDE